ncbi:hypothetical protein H4219_001184 [Mycoemilia scoparia]|uniref:Cation/H+ exchanger transmembrane domain-containing protein n=1 Tax=Mycoemilia scoparia TaxID=417184 RepID=A0A9W8A0V2_9FUNG|nr:hypothetical protein H4219_001184 [Mycoemilia scoparia]
MAHGDPAKVVPACLGGFIVFYGLVSGFVKERLYLSEALVATVFGIIIGPKAINIVMAAGMTLPKKYMLRKWRSLAVLFGPVMVVMWLVSGALMIPFIKLSILNALLVASCVTPTDPILANSIVKGRFAEAHVPRNVRDVLSAESGANDAMAKWFYWIWAFEILLSIVIGIVVGYIARKVLYFAQDRELIDKESFLSFGIALALFIVGCLTLIGSDDILACFCAGHSFTWDDWFSQETKDAHFQEVLDSLINITFFVYFGTIIPWSDFNNPELQLTPWRLVVVAILILLFRRMPIVVALTKITPAFKTYGQSAFAGWFGPIGVGAVFFSELAIEDAEENGGLEFRGIQVIRPVVFFLVLSSVIVHGITVPIIRFGKAVHTRTMSSSSMLSNVMSRLSFSNSRQVPPQSNFQVINIYDSSNNLQKPNTHGDDDDKDPGPLPLPFEKTITIDDAPRLLPHEIDIHKALSPNHNYLSGRSDSGGDVRHFAKDQTQSGGLVPGRHIRTKSNTEVPIKYNPELAAYSTTSSLSKDGTYSEMLTILPHDIRGGHNGNGSRSSIAIDTTKSSIQPPLSIPPHMRIYNPDRWINTSKDNNVESRRRISFVNLEAHRVRSQSMPDLEELASREQQRVEEEKQSNEPYNQRSSLCSDEIVELDSSRQEPPALNDPYRSEIEQTFTEGKEDLENPLATFGSWVSDRVANAKRLWRNKKTRR